MKFIDTHAHTYLEAFREDEKEIFERLQRSEISKVIMPNVDLDTMGQMFAQEERYPQILRSALGLHPCSVRKESYNSDLDSIKQEINSRDIVAIGEIGIDLYWDKTTKEQQIEAYRRQLDWARTLGIPALIHSRDALDLTIEIATEMQDGRLTPVFHCFNGNVEQGLKIRDIGGYVGLGGVVTYKNAGMAEVVPKLDPSIILLETDSPYLSPVPKRGKRNEPAYILYVAEKIAEYKGATLDEISGLTTSNALRIFPN